MKFESFIKSDGIQQKTNSIAIAIDIVTLLQDNSKFTLQAY